MPTTHFQSNEHAPALRLINAPWQDSDAASPGGDTPRRSRLSIREAREAAPVDERPSPAHVDAVTRENAAAARSVAALTPGDARWVFAVRVAAALESNPKGTPLGLLSPEKREGLLATAAKLGLRPFDANLVVAILQDSARRGLHPLGPDAASRLELIPRPEPRRPSTLNTALAASSSVLLAAAMLLTLLGWVLR